MLASRSRAHLIARSSCHCHRYFLLSFLKAFSTATPSTRTATKLKARAGFSVKRQEERSSRQDYKRLLHKDYELSGNFEQDVRIVLKNYGFTATQAFRIWLNDSNIQFEKLRKIHSLQPDQFEENLKNAFERFKLRDHGSDFMQKERLELMDLRHPASWFPGTRQVRRTWHLHLGPTNSGKTYNALKRLEEVGLGVYAGPLRLLAHEIYDRLNAKGIRCNLITGEERVAFHHEPQVVSCTVEMASLDTTIDVAVIDEIQMIADPSRGWAWTHALLGIKAAELHICGELRAMDIVKSLAKLCGDDVVVHEYQRLGPLEVEYKPLKSLKELQKGDCVVAFSRKRIYALAEKIEQETNLKCAVVYGNLPPETRAAQAKLFNDPKSDLDILVASDAIGMGLNLNVRRIIFDSMTKFDGVQTLPVEVPQVLQIAGRAGRFRTSHEDMTKTNQMLPLVATEDSLGDTLTLTKDHSEHAEQSAVGATDLDFVPPVSAPRTGYVTTFSGGSLKMLQKSMGSTAPQIRKAVVQPTAALVQKFASLFPSNTPFALILEEMTNTAKTSDLFNIGNFDDNAKIANIIENIKGFSVEERFKFCCSPCKTKDPNAPPLIRAFAQVIADGRAVSIIDIPEVDLEALDEENFTTQDDLRRLEALHGSIMLYLWLNFRFPGNFLDMQIAKAIKRKTEEKIDIALKELRKSRKKIPAKVTAKVLEETSMEDSDAMISSKLEDVADTMHPDSTTGGERKIGDFFEAALSSKKLSPQKATTQKHKAIDVTTLNSYHEKRLADAPST